MAVLSLPLSFTNSFWSQDYRRGLQVLFNKLEQGIAENDEVVAFVKARSVAEEQLALTLLNPAITGAPETGFGADDGASLLVAFRGLQAESVADGQAHMKISRELKTLVADPFDDWSKNYKEKLRQRKATVFDHWLWSFEEAQGEVLRLKQEYLEKTRRSDEAEDDARFAPGSAMSDTYTISPSLKPHDGRSPPQRSASVSERITQRLREIQAKSVGALSAKPDPVPEELFQAHDVDEKSPPLQKVDKGKGKAVEFDDKISLSPAPLSPVLPPAVVSPPSPPAPPVRPSPVLLAGLSLSPSEVSQLLKRAATELPLGPVRFPLLGEYKDCFNGEEFVAWLQVNVEGLGGSIDRAEIAARDLTEREGLLRRIGEFGNEFQHADDAFYQFRPKAFDLAGKAEANVTSPAGKAVGLPSNDNLLKRTSTLVSMVTKVLNSQSEPGHLYMKARQEADAADKAYRIAVRVLDRHRLGLEERLEETLKTSQKWELERLKAIKAVLLQYHEILASVHKTLEPSTERSATLITSYQPEADLTALIERYRTGPFRPDPQIYESVSHDEFDVVFGIDLRKWAEGGWNDMTSGEEKKELVPFVLTGMLNGLKDAYEKLPDDDEKRKAWIYEVPLPAVHHLREALNTAAPDKPIPAELLANYDVPVLAAAVKLWVLELNPPLALWEGWEDFRKLYPTVGSAVKHDSDEAKQQHITDLGAALQKLPRVHLYVLDAIFSHLNALINSTIVKEANEVYITKLALSFGRAIIRPKNESELSIQDRHPTHLFIDLLTNYDALLPPTIARKKRESERKIPLRKRTAPVDMRLHRSRISIDDDPRQLLVAQRNAQNPKASKSLSPENTPRAPAAVLSLNSPPRASPPIPAPAPAPVIVPPPAPAAVPASPPVPAPPPPPPPAPASILVPPPPAPPAAAPRADEAVATPRALQAQVLPESTPIAPAKANPNAPPPRPTFKEPPPEVDDLPPRPTFKEPPPEHDEVPPRPQFAEPPAEMDDAPAPPPPLPVSVTPATPRGHVSERSLSPSPSVSPSKGSRSTSPNAEDALNQLRPVNVRGPRLSRGPRVIGGGGVSSMVSNLNRRSAAGSPPGSESPPTGMSTPTYKRLSNGSGPGSRSNSVLGRTGAFSRRTMASDAEDDVVDRK